VIPQTLDSGSEFINGIAEAEDHEDYKGIDTSGNATGSLKRPVESSP